MAHAFMQPGMGSWYSAAAIAQSATQQAHLSHRALEPAPRVDDPPAQGEDKHDGHCHTRVVEIVLGDCRGGTGGRGTGGARSECNWAEGMLVQRDERPEAARLARHGRLPAEQRCSGAAF